MSQPLCKHANTMSHCPDHGQYCSLWKNVSLHTFKKWPLSALCVIDPNNAFFISRCKDVLRLPGWRKEWRQQLDTINCNSPELCCVSSDENMVCIAQVCYQRRKPVQTEARSHPGCRRRCARHVGHTGSPPARTSEGTWARDLQGGLGRSGTAFQFGDFTLKCTKYSSWLLQLQTVFVYIQRLINWPTVLITDRFKHLLVPAS